MRNLRNMLQKVLETGIFLHKGPPLGNLEGVRLLGILRDR